MKGAEGLLYVPTKTGSEEASCEDCHFCQWCSDNRCSLCLDQKSCCVFGRNAPLPEDEACRERI